MKRVKNLLTILLISVLTFGISLFATKILQQEVWAASISWDGTGDAISWSDPLNWSTDTVPTDVDDVLIDADVTVNLSSGTTVNSLILGNSGGTTSPILNFTYNSVGTNAPLVIDSGNLEIFNGGTITHTVGTSAIVGTINIDIQAGNLIINTDASINANEKGYYKGSGPGLGPTYAGSGYGGYGGNAPDGTGGGIAYGFIDNPNDLGSGGSSTIGGIGGGLVTVVVSNNLLLDGTITTNGGNGTTSTFGAGGGASGGSINISIGNIWSGDGSISSNGGNGGSYMNTAGGGGGGRIAIKDYSSKTFTGTITAYGGGGSPNYNGSYIARDGASGTIFLQQDGQSPDIIINNGGNTDLTLGGVTPLSYGSIINTLTMLNYSYVRFDSTLSIGDIESNSNSYILVNNEVLADNVLIAGASKVFANSDLTISQLLDLDKGYLDINSLVDVTYATFNFNGELVDNGASFAYLEESSLNIPSGATLYANYPRTYVNGLIEGILSHSSNTDTLVNKIDYTFTGDLTISSAGSIDVSGKGYSGGNGPGPGTLGNNYNGGGGGAHGGDGGDGESGYLGGTAYDLSTNPQDFGSGGGGNSGIVGGNGGGLVLLDIGETLDLQGSILANGGDGTTRWGEYSSGGGGGGGINITVGALTGNGPIEAIGGTAYPSVNNGAYGGGGGGGLISIIYEESTFTGTAVATGGIGANNGEDGVVNISASNQPPEALYSNISTPQSLYAGFSYSIDAIYSDPDGQDDISELYLKLQNPAGDDIELKATGSDIDLVDQTAEALGGSTYIDTPKYSIYPTYGTANEIKVTWTFDIGWNWTETTELNYGVQTVDSAAASSSYSLTTEGFKYNKTLIFNTTGSFLVTTESGDPISTQSWLLPGSTVNWTGYNVVYEGETDVYPNPDDYNIKLEDGTGRFWLDSGSEGEDFELITETIEETTTENIYTLSIVDLPTGGVSTDSKEFIIKVDAQNPTILSFLSTTHSDEETWYSVSEVEIQWEVEDSHSGINETYTYVSNNSETSISTVRNSGTLMPTTSFTTDTLENGIYYIYLLTIDSVGNQVLESLSVKIDSSVPDIVEVRGPYKGTWQNVDSGPPLTWNNPLSISGDTFYITTNGSLPTKSNFRYATNQTQYNIEQLGDGVHTINVRACNGANTCGVVRSFLVKYDSVSTSIVKNISTSLSSSNRVTLNWSNPTESDFSKVIVVRKVGSASSTINDGTKIYEGTNTSFADTTLNSSTTYHYAIWAYDHVGNVSARNSISVTTLDLRAPGAVNNFKAVLENSNSVKLTWSNPEDTDFSGVLLYRDDLLIYEGEEQEYIDTLDIEGEYEYVIKAFDSSDNLSSEESITYNFVLASENIVLVKEDSNPEKVEEGKNSKVKTGESVEIKIPVKKLMGDVELQDTDRVVLSISDVEYDLLLSEDRTYFSTRFVAPTTKGNHNISIRALRGDSVLAQMDLDIEVVDDDEGSSYEKTNEQEEDSSSYIYWIVGPVLLLLTISSIAFISKRKGKEA